jgi:transposase
MTTTTVVSGPDRRRRWSAADKLRIAEESLASGLSVVEFARQRDIAPSRIHAWRRQAKSGELSAGPAAEVQFAPVVVTTRSGVAVAPISDPGDGLMVEVVLRNGRLLRLSERMAPTRAALLADAMEGCAR